MTVSTTTASTMVDPYAPISAPAWRYLHGLNPLAKLLPALPAMIALVFARDHLTPLAFVALTYVLLLTGARMTKMLATLLFAVVPLGIAVIGVGFSLWVAAERVADTPAVLQVGEWTLHTGALSIGFATSLRLAAILSLALIGGLTTTGPELVRAAVQQLRLPYRIGYTALAAYRFVPRFGHELAVIRAAHRVRGHHGGNGPFARIARAWGYIVPLLAGAIRHAERVALAMDSRAFGAHATRTERHVMPFRRRDWVFSAAFIAASTAILVVLFPWQTAGA